jgi:hypothetical protein
MHQIWGRFTEIATPSRSCRNLFLVRSALAPLRKGRVDVGGTLLASGASGHYVDSSGGGGKGIQ